MLSRKKIKTLKCLPSSSEFAEHLHCLEWKGGVEAEWNTEATSLGERYSPYKSLQPPETIIHYVHCLFPRTPLLNHLCKEVQRTSTVYPEQTKLH